VLSDRSLADVDAPRRARRSGRAGPVTSSINDTARVGNLAASMADEFLGALLALAPDGTILYWNAGAETLFGYAASEVIGRSILETIVPPEQVEEKRRWLAAVLDGGSALYESVRRRKGGLQIWVDTAVKVARDSDGNAYLMLNERDITRVKYQRDAQVLQTRFREVLEAAPDAIVLVDSLGRITLVNSETERLFGYTRDELLGQLVEELVPTRFHANHPTHRTKYFTEPQTRPMGIGLELSGRRKDGTEFPVEISLSPLSIETSTLAMAAIRDVSARKKIEEALKTVNRELEAFTYSVSHDLRAPIRQIDGFARILSEQLGPEIDEKVAHYLNRIRDGAGHMGHLVDDLLNLAKIGRQDLRPRLVELTAIANDAMTDLRSDVPGRNITWQLDTLPSAKCDPGLMKIVFTNLLSNAVKYSRPRPTAIIHIGCTLEHGEPTIFVRDNGVGFDMEYADKLFGVFQRLHRVEDFEGTGVGLATVQRIVHKHGGEIWAEGERDSGATFYFTLESSPGDRTGEAA
jgi:PAS domain S-box-containing protein